MTPSDKIPPLRPPLSRPPSAVLLTGALVALLGLTVMIGWYTHNLRLIHVFPAFVGMAYNTALGFLLCGTALLASGLRQRKVAAFCGVLCLVLGLGTLAEYVSGVDLGLDELLMKAYTRSGITQFGRMAFATALSFFLSGTAFLLFLRRGRAGDNAGAGLMGALVFALGAIALSGYFSGITLAYHWGQFTRMAVHTAAGFLVLGTGLVVLAWREDAAGREVGSTDTAPHWLPALVGLGAATVTLCLWQSLVVEQNAQRALIARLPAGRPLLHTQQLLLDGALASGLLLGGLLSGAVALTQVARRRAAALDRANADLSRSRGELEARVAERTAALADANAGLARANKALRDVLMSVTEGRFHLCESAADLPPPLEALGEPFSLVRVEAIPALRHAARDAAQRGGLSDERREDLELAVSEAAMNAVVHSHEGVGQICLHPDGTIQVWVMDTGPGITMENLPRATLERGYTTAGTLGHGFWLMLNSIDRLWLLTGTSGTTVVLEQYCTAPEPAWLGGRSVPLQETSPSHAGLKVRLHLLAECAQQFPIGRGEGDACVGGPHNRPTGCCP